MKINNRYVIDTGGNPRTNHQLNRHASRVGHTTEVSVGAVAIRQNPTVSIQRQLCARNEIAAMHGTQQFLAACGYPLDRPTGFSCGKRNYCIFTVHTCLHAKAATHISHLHANILRVHF